jgi:hypothetical protein
MNPMLLFWAKLGNETWPEKYHPVICHLIDVAAVTQNLWDAVFRPQFRKWLAGRLGLDETPRNTSLADFHDCSDQLPGIRRT